MAVKGKQAVGKSGKGKDVAGPSRSSKRKSASKTVDSDDHRSRKRSRPEALGFIDDEAMDADSEEEELSDSGDDFIEHDDDLTCSKQSAKTARIYAIPVDVKEEEAYDAELEKYIKERFARRSNNVVHEDEWEDTKDFEERVDLGPTKTDPNLWKVKCMVGRERWLTFCLIQKFFDLSVKNELKITSAFALDHLKGYIFIEAEKESDVIEACKGFCNIYLSRITLVPKNEAPHLLSVQSKSYGVSIGTWVRMKSGIYKGDLAKVVAVDSKSGRATVQLIPRIDLRSLAQKFGGGVTSKPSSVPAPRLIRSYELREFRAHVENRRDGQTGEIFEILDGLMLKDGYLYKKVSLKSLSYWDIQPSMNEIHKFEVAEDGAESLDWLPSVYGGGKQNRCVKDGKVLDETSKGGQHFRVLDFVLINQKDFGVIISIEDDLLKVLKVNYDIEEIVCVTLEEIKSQIHDKMFTALDKQKTTISIGNHVRVLLGRHEGKEGLVKHMYRGAIFVYDANQSDNCGLFCTKSEFVEKTSTKATSREDTDHASHPLGLDNSISSNPESPKQATRHDNYHPCRSSKQVDGDQFCVGQTLRIRVGPLKGYLCQVVALYRSDVTVKLQSKSKIIKVNCDHLSELKSCGSSFRSVDLPISDFGNPLGEGNREGPMEDGPNKGTEHLNENCGWNVNEPFPKRDAWNTLSSSLSFGSPVAMTCGIDERKTGEDQENNDPWGNTAGQSSQLKDGWAKADVWGSSSDDRPSAGWDKAEGAPSKTCVNKLNQGPSNVDVAEHGYDGTKNSSEEGVCRKSEDDWSTESKLACGSQMANWGNNWNKEKDVSGQCNWEQREVDVNSDSWSKASEQRGKEAKTEELHGNSWDKGCDAANSHNIGHNRGWDAVGSQDASPSQNQNQSDCWNRMGSFGTASESDPCGKAIKNLNAENMTEADKDGAWTKNSNISGSGNSSWGIAVANEVQAVGSQYQNGGWNTDKSWGDAKEFSWNKGNSFFGEEGGTSYKVDDWNKPKTVGTSWGEQSRADDGDWNTDQHGSWNKPNRSFTGGRVSGARRGRGDFSGRGRFSGRSRLGGWNNDQEGGCNQERDSWRDRGKSWKGGRGCEPGGASGKGFDGSRNERHLDCWGKANKDDGDYGSGWNRGQDAQQPGGKEGDWNGKVSSWKNQSSGWNRGADGEGECWGNSVNWKGGANQSEEDSGVWYSKNSFGEDKPSGEWSKGKESSGWMRGGGSGDRGRGRGVGRRGGGGARNHGRGYSGGRSSGWNNSDKGKGVGDDHWSPGWSQGDKASFKGDWSCSQNSSDKGSSREWSSSGWSNGGKESDFPGNCSSSNWRNGQRGFSSDQSSGWETNNSGGTFGGNPFSGWNTGDEHGVKGQHSCWKDGGKNSENDTDGGNWNAAVATIKDDGNICTAGSKWGSWSSSKEETGDDQIGRWNKSDVPEKTKTGYDGSARDQATTSKNETGSTAAEADTSWEARGSGGNPAWGGKSEW